MHERHEVGYVRTLSGRSKAYRLQVSITSFYDFHSGISEPRTVARLFGRFEVFCAGVRVDARLPPQARVLLAYLLVHRGETLRRDHLAERLWPQNQPVDARSALRHALVAIARALPPATVPWLACGARSVTWCGDDAATWVDAREFEALSAGNETLEEEAHLYRGDFAPGLDHPWVNDLRERHRARSSWALDELMTRYAARHDMRGALAYGEALLELDPWREDALCNTMLFRYRLGDRAGSLWAYRRFCLRLKDEFGIEPMPMTQRCYAAISAKVRL